MPYSWNKPPKTMRTQTIRNARAAAKTAGPASRPPGPGVLRQEDVAKGAKFKAQQGGVLRQADVAKYQDVAARPSASALRSQQEKESLLRTIAEPGVLTESDIRKLRQVMSRLQESGVLRREDEAKYNEQIHRRRKTKY
jgi:hypothetical protein